MRELDKTFMYKYNDVRKALLVNGMTMGDYFNSLTAAERITMQKIRNYRNQLAFTYPTAEASEKDVDSWLATLNQALEKIA